MIQRAAAVSSNTGAKDVAGKWIDVVWDMNGNISPIDGGICWEQLNINL